MRTAIAAIAVTIFAALCGLIGASHAAADPGCIGPPGSQPWYNPCSGTAPWNQNDWSPVDGLPGRYGPRFGYTPDTGQPGGPQWCFAHTGSFRC